MADDPAALPRPDGRPRAAGDFASLLASPGLADKSWVTEQYDRHVRGNTVLATPQDAGVIRIDEQTGLGIALATDGNGRFSLLDPYAGAQLALAEAYRNVAVTGAVPLAVTNCLNFGSPEDPGVMWQFSEAVRGLADGCAALGVPVTGGNVSFYNQTDETPIHPTPVVGVLGVHADVTRRVPIGLRTEGAPIVLLGRTAAEFDGSAWAQVTHGHCGGRPPEVDLARRAGPGRGADRGGRRRAAGGGPRPVRGRPGHRAGRVLPGPAGLGCQVALQGDLFTQLFSESAARAVVAVRPGSERAFTALAAGHGVPVAELGRSRRGQPGRAGHLRHPRGRARGGAPGYAAGVVWCAEAGELVRVPGPAAGPWHAARPARSVQASQVSKPTRT